MEPSYIILGVLLVLVLRARSVSAETSAATTPNPLLQAINSALDEIKNFKPGKLEVLKAYPGPQGNGAFGPGTDPGDDDEDGEASGDPATLDGSDPSQFDAGTSDDPTESPPLLDAGTSDDPAVNAGTDPVDVDPTDKPDPSEDPPQDEDADDDGNMPTYEDDPDAGEADGSSGDSISDENNDFC